MGTTLADHLRSLSDGALCALLQRRPDLTVPPPADISTLAVRAQSRVSAARALDALDEFTLRILDAARLTRNPDTSVDAVLAMSQGADPAAVNAALDRLRGLCLLYGPDAALHVAGGVDEVCSPYPAGLGRPAKELDQAAAALHGDPAGLRRTLLSAPPPARAVLDRLAAGPPVGTLATGADADNPVRWLVTRHLLVPIDVPTGGDGHETVELPRELGLLLRRDTGPLGPLRTAPPPVEGPVRDPAATDAAGAGQTMEAVRQVAALVEALGNDPAPVLRTGGLGVREVRRLARTAGMDEQLAPLLLEIAHAAALTGEAEPPGTRGAALLLPTPAYDGWCALPLAQRWERLGLAWLGMTRQPGLVGQRDDRDKPVNALSPEAERAGAPATRHTVLRALAELPAGTAPDTDALLHALAWHQPRRIKGREPAYREVLLEAATLGVTGLGALTSYGRALLADAAAEAAEDPLGLREGTDPPAGAPAVRALDALLPAPVDHVLIQADLTVVVPGPPEPALAAELGLAAEHESAGGASVYRVTPDSVRRALDAGYAADDLHAMFKRRSRTPVPQSLSYLVDDVARRHGGLRVGSAGAYLRSDDEALLAQLMADKRLAPMALRRLAPTVLTTPYQSARLLEALRGAGYAPVQEDARGAILLTRAKARRAPARGMSPRRPAGRPLPTGPRLLALVEHIRHGDAVARASRRAPVTVRAANGHGIPGLAAVQAHTQALAVLQQAVRDKARVWVGYVDAHGGTASRLVRPVSIGGGYLRAEDERTDMLHTFALHRITAAVIDQ